MIASQDISLQRSCLFRWQSILSLHLKHTVIGLLSWFICEHVLQKYLLRQFFAIYLVVALSCTLFCCFIDCRRSHLKHPLIVLTWKAILVVGLTASITDLAWTAIAYSNSLSDKSSLASNGRTSASHHANAVIKIATSFIKWSCGS